MTNDELLIGIKDIRTFAGRICKGTESDRSDGVVDFRSNGREASAMQPSRVTPPYGSTTPRIKNIEYTRLRIDNNRALERCDSEFCNIVSYRAKTGLMTVGCKTRIKEV